MTIHLFYFYANRGQESSMKKWWFNSMWSKKELERSCGLSKSTESLGPIENTSRGEDPSLNDTEKNIQSWQNNDSSSYSNGDHFFRVMDIRNFISDDTFVLRDSKGNSYSIYFDIENQIFEIDKDHSFLSELQINNCIDSYLYSQICIGSSIPSGSDSYIFSYIFGEDGNRSESFSLRTIRDDSNFTKKESSKNLDVTQKYRHLWVQCENCYGLNYKKLLKSKMHICEQCGYHLKMSSSDRIELPIDQGTWNPMDEDMVSMDPIEFYSEEERYKDRIDSYQKKTGLTEAVQTGIGQLNGIPVAIGVMDFQFMGGSMGSVVGEKITRLIEYATKNLLPLIIVCASGGARMQEGSLSLMQMAKISAALYDYQSNKKLFYVPILTSPTTGGVTASFGMLGDIIIAEPNAYIAFAGKRVIEQTLNKTVPEGSQAAEYLFHKGLLDPIVPRNLLKGVLSELFQLHAFFPLNQNQVEH
uniref:Acetyl-coenzyme A carboxylase carboxyl transferase subunit beta n=2 Tax=Anredera cordifolia TaxID=46150 RepID=A0A411JNC7_ANRCO|nr:acetyl-CoA carboxylase carboxyltransferase beta subunit [Anredera cordifolia]QBC66444.1 acetyl-CoA carboxylase carboxyltransferase beta subunit [Anredera cordifolia]QBC66529.1 acetyl-CoA carboxylase carboxyltransferase beta subunit [Anredera cordifolia]